MGSIVDKGRNFQKFHLHDIFVDYDCDSIIYLEKPDGPTCHTGSETCYLTSISELFKEQEYFCKFINYVGLYCRVEENNLALTTLYSLELIS
ncbi:hypothetical protein REPUB_Repub07fG0100200 [Reevesia pubescens]